MRQVLHGPSGIGLALWVVAACSSTPSSSGFDPENPSGASTSRSDGATGTFGGTGGTGASAANCSPNPANFDVPGNQCDDDGNGKVDDAAPCDDGLAIGGDAMAFARALGLCQTAGANDTRWGVVSASYTRGYGASEPPADGQHGILPKFGDVVRPREGKMLAALSTGWAREFDGAAGQTAFKGDKPGMQAGGLLSRGQAPPGYPKSSPNCPSLLSVVYDVASVKLQIRVPANAQGLKFDFDFWSGEWPEFVCSRYNDAFVAFLTSKAFNGGTPDNISFDSKNSPVSVNNGFFDRCTANTPTGCLGSGKASTSQCPGGVSELAGTGFLAQGVYCGLSSSSGGGATGWLTSKAPVAPGETITLEFMIWDTGDESYDSLVTVDNFTWEPGPVITSTERAPPPR